MMTIRLRLYAVTTLASLAALCVAALNCNRGPDGYESAIESGRRDVDIIRDVERLFPGARHLITHYNGRAGTPLWQTTVPLHNRYVLAVRFIVTLDPTRTRIVSREKGEFILFEIGKIQNDGRFESISGGEVDLSFGEEQWKKVVDANGDLGVLGVKLKPDRPVDGFEAFFYRYTGGSSAKDGRR